MDRHIVYPGAIPVVEDALISSRYGVIGLGHALGAAYGQQTVFVGGMTASINGMTVIIGHGSLNYPAPVDQSSFGTLTADTATIIQQAILENDTNVTVPADGKLYTIAVSAVTADDENTVLPYYNAANPSQTFAGPNNNSGTDLPTRRPVTAVLALYARGSVPASYFPLYDVSAPVGSTQIQVGNLVQNASAPAYWTIPGLQTAITNETARAKSVEVNLELEIESKAPLFSPAFIGAPTTPSPPPLDNSAQVPNTDWVLGAILSGFILPMAKTNPGYVTLPGGVILNYGTAQSGNGGVYNISYVKPVNATLVTFACEVAANGSWFGGNGQGAPTVYGCYGQTNAGMTVLCMSWVASAAAWQGHQGGGFSWLSLGI